MWSCRGEREAKLNDLLLVRQCFMFLVAESNLLPCCAGGLKGIDREEDVLSPLALGC